MTTAALIPGSFDPPTRGHLDVIERCVSIFDRVRVGVIANPAKDPLFTAEQRMALLVECCEQWPSVEVDQFSGLLVDYADAEGIRVVVKGLRVVTDFDYELQMAQMNRHLSSDVVTLFVATKPEFGYLSSSLVKQVARLGGSVEALVPEPVALALKEAFSP